MTFVGLRFARRFLRRGYGRLVLTVVALAAGVALVCSINLVNRAVLRAFEEIVETMAGKAALQVTAGEGALLPEDLGDVVAKVAGVRLVVPVVQGTAFTADDTGELLTVHGVDITNDDAVRVYESRDSGGLELDDPLVFLSQPDSVMLTRAFAERRGLAVDDRITLVTPRGNLTFVVRGLLDPRGVARVYGGSLVVMDVLAAERVFGEPGFVNRFDVVLRPGAEVAPVSKAIAEALPPGVRIDAPAHRKIEIGKIVASLQGVLQGMAAVALVAAFLVVFNRLSAVFERRLWQLGVMRAVGARRWVVTRELLKESVLLGLLGAVVGIPLGVVLARALLPAVAATTALNNRLLAPEADLQVSVGSCLLAGALGVGASVLGGLLPAWRSSAAALAEVIRQAGLEPGARRGSGTLLRLAVVAVLAMVVALEWLTGVAVWGLFATVLVGVVTALAARPLLSALERPVVTALRMLPGPTGLFAARTLARHPRRAGLTIAMIGVGVGSVVWLWTLAHSFEASLVDALGHAFRADLLLSSSHMASGFDDAPVDGALVEEARSLTGVRDVIGERIVDWHHAGGPIALDAFDPGYFTSGSFGRWKLVGHALPDVWEQVAAGTAVIVSTSFIRNIGVRVGDRLTLDTPEGPLTVVIAGATSAFASPRGTVEMSRALYQRYWHDNQVVRVHLMLDQAVDVEAVRADVARHFGVRYRLRILSAAELLAFWTDQVRRAFAGLHAVAGLVLLVVLVGIADTLAAGVIERRRELATVRAVGARRGVVRSIVMGEAMLLGVIGLVLAGAAGVALGWLWVDLTLPLLIGWTLEFHMPGLVMLGIAVATLGVSVVAGLVPAVQAAAVSPSMGLRYE